MTRLIPAFTWATLLAVVLSLVIPAHAEPATEAADLEMELQILEDFHAIQAKEANKPVDELNARYKAALEKYRVDSQAAGNLAAVLAANAALEKLAAGETPGGSSDTSVANLEKAYLTKLAAARAAVAENMLKAEREFLASLDKLVTKLTKAGEIEEAVKVKAIRDTLAAGMKERAMANGAAIPRAGRSALPDMVLIPAGTFQMGDTFKEGEPVELPVHAVYVSAFYMAKHEVSKALWDEVREWALSSGYTDLAAGGGKAADHPVNSISWYDMVKWCNARSEKEGLTPCYHTDKSHFAADIYRTGKVDITNEMVKWRANGYRLPTEAEWEKAARGGLKGKRFPWGDTISHEQANYVSDAKLAYDVSASRGRHPNHAHGGDPFTCPVASLAPNGFGLYNMAGNVWDRCWDWFGAYDAASKMDPRGPATGLDRVARGGSWLYDGRHCRAAVRGFTGTTNCNSRLGFRPARSSVP